MISANLKFQISNFRCEPLRLALFIAALAFAVPLWSAADAPEPIAQPIADVPLTNGRVLHNATIVRFEKDWVVLKTNGGTGPVNYAMIAEPLRGRIVAARDAQIAKDHAPVIVGANDATKVTGRAYSGEGDHIFKFKGVSVGFVPRVFALKKMNPTLGSHEPFDHYAAVTTANDEGEFVADVPPGEYIVYCACRRQYPNRNWVRFEWVLEVTIGSEPVNLVLNDDNAKFGFDDPKPRPKKAR